MHEAVINLLADARAQGYRARRVGGSVELTQDGELVALVPMGKDVELRREGTALWKRLNQCIQVDQILERFVRG